VDDTQLLPGARQHPGLSRPNGAGKTTTLRMMLGIIPPDAGTIRVSAEHRAVRARIGYLPEGAPLQAHARRRHRLYRPR